MARGVLLDIAGVLTEGAGALPHAANAVASLRATGLPVRFVTNTTSKPRRAVVETLNAVGIPVQVDELFTPARAAKAWLIENGFHAHLLSTPPLEEDFADLDENSPPAVVVGDAGPGLTFEALNAAFQLLTNGAPFIALATNRVFTNDRGELTMDVGAFVKALEYSSEVTPMVMGKPEGVFFKSAADSMGLDLSDCVMIGDDAEFDVAGALCAGVGEAYLVKTGKYRAGDETRHDPPPTRVFEHIGLAAEFLTSGT